MARKQIIATVDKKGEIEFEAEGFKGGECTKAIDELVKKMGGKSKKSKKKAMWRPKTKVNVEQH